MNTHFITNPGKVRTHNEDSVNIFKNKNNEVLMVVADGMGGHKAGEVASCIAIDEIEKDFKLIDKFKTKQETVNWIRKIASSINNKIFKYTDEHPESKGMGTTLVLSIFTKEYLLFGNIGDSSGYVLKKNKLFKITNDHTLVNLLVSTGELSEEAARNHPRKNVVMKALGAVNPAEIDVFDVDKNVEGILLCSDGLTTMLTNEQIEKVLNTDCSIEDKLNKLITKCNNRGGNDNISIALLINGGDV